MAVNTTRAGLPGVAQGSLDLDADTAMRNGAWGNTRVYPGQVTGPVSGDELRVSRFIDHMRDCEGL